MASLSKVLAAVAVFVAAVALSGDGVYAQTHHVVGGEKGWGADLDVDSWLSGRVFSVGDKIWFKYSGTENSVVELRGPEEFLSCNLTNPIRMYTDPVSHVVLDKEGFRYFTSRNPERCKNGLKLPVPVKPASKFDRTHELHTPPFDPPFPGEVPTPPVDPHPPFKPSPPVEPHPPVYPSPPVDPNPPFKPSPPVEPHPPVKPTPPYEPPVHFPPPPVPAHPPPAPVRPPPPPPPILPPPPPHKPPPPSAATRVEILSFVLGAALLLCSIGCI